MSPAGKTLTTTGMLVNDGETMLYIASVRDCVRCPLKFCCICESIRCSRLLTN
jgi:hypothetical protein